MSYCSQLQLESLGLRQLGTVSRPYTFRGPAKKAKAGPSILAATVKGRYKRVWVGEQAGLSGPAFYDPYTDPWAENGKLLPMFPAKGMFNIMKLRHELWMAKYPNTGEQRGFPLTGIENARPDTDAGGKPRVDPSKLPFDPQEFIKSMPSWENYGDESPD